MPETLRFNRDAVAGLLLVAIGIAVLVFGRFYPMGSLRQPGPGFLPMGVAGLLILLGGLIALRGLFAAGYRAGIERLRPRSLLAILGIVLFGLTVGGLGFVVAALLLLGLGIAANDQMRWRDFVVIALVMVPACALVFIKGLGQLIPVWPW